MKKIDMFLERIGLIFTYAIPFSLFVYSADFLFAEVTLKLFVFQILVGLFALVCGLAIVRRVGRAILLDKLHLALLAFLAATTIASLFGIDPFQSFFGTAERVIGLLALWSFYVYGLGMHIFLSEQYVGKFVRFQIFVAAGMALLAIAQRLFGSMQGDGFFMVSAGSRTGGTLGNPTYLAGYLLPFLFAVGALLIGRIRQLNGKTAMFMFAGIAILAGFMVANTRGAIIGLLVGLAYLVGTHLVSRFKEGRLSKKWLIAMIASVLLFGGILVSTRQAALWQYLPPLDRLARISLTDISTVNRLTSWQVALRGFAKHPIFGVGYENYAFLADRDYNPTQLRGGMGETFFDKPHNAVLEIAATTGIVGLLAYGWLVVMMWRFIGRLQDIRTRRVARAALIGYLVQNLFLFDTFGTLLVFFGGIGLLSALTIKENEVLPPAKTPLLRWLTPPVLAVFGIGMVVYSTLALKGASDHFLMYRDFKLDEADTAYQSYLRAESNPVYPFKIKLMRDALESVAEQAQLLPVPTVIRIMDPLFAKADALVERYPDNYPLLITLNQTKLIVARFGKKYLDGVESQIQKAIAFSPNRQQNYYALANFYLLNDRADDAKGTMQKAIELDPASGDPYFQAGLIAYRLTGKTDALPFFIKAAERGYRGENKDEALMLGNFLGDAEYYDLSYESYRQARALMGDDPELLAKMALVSYYADYRERAKIHFEELLRIDASAIKNSPNYPVFEQIFSDLGITAL